MYVLISNHAQKDWKNFDFLSLDIWSSKKIFSFEKLLQILSKNAQILNFLNSNYCCNFFIDTQVRAESLFGTCRSTIRLENDFSTEVGNMIETLFNSQCIDGEVQLCISIIRMKYQERFATLLVLDEQFDFIQNSWTCKKRKDDKIDVNEVTKKTKTFSFNDFHQVREIIFNCLPDIDIPDI